MNLHRLTLLVIASLTLTLPGYAQTIPNSSFENGYPADPAIVPFISNAAATGWTAWNYYENYRGPEWINTSSPDWTHAVTSGVPGASDGAFYMALDSVRTTETFESITDNIYAEAGIRTTISGLSIGEQYVITFDAFSLGTDFPSGYQQNGFLDVYVAEDSASLHQHLIQSLAVIDRIIFTAGFTGMSATDIGSYSFIFTATAADMEFGIRSRMQETNFTGPTLMYTTGVDNFSITPAPEPSGAVLLGVAGMMALLRRRKRQAWLVS